MSAVRPFRVARWLKNRHAQTIGGRYLRPTKGVLLQRERLSTPDGDFVDLDFSLAGQPEWDATDKSKPIVLLLHGLEGSSKSGYAYQVYQRLESYGIRCVGFNFRSCSGELNRLPRLYHSGDTGDVALVIDVLRERYPNARIGAIGVSLGGNVLLKYMGERGSDAPLEGVVTVSVPYDLSACANSIHHGPSRIYGGHLLRKLKAKVRSKKRQLSDVCDVKAGLAARSIRAFDQHVTAPVFGFDDAEDYYQQCSSQRYIGGIRKPTLILTALDDPFLPADSIPYDLIRKTKHVDAVFCDHGGHVGFVEGTPREPTFWSEREATAQMARLLG